jgi:hypothetical protein
MALIASWRVHFIFWLLMLLFNIGTLDLSSNALTGTLSSQLKDLHLLSKLIRL